MHKFRIIMIVIRSVPCWWSSS